MAADLEDVFEYYRAAGMGDDEAARRAEEKVIGSGGMLHRLAEMHRAPFVDWPRSGAGRLGSRGDIALLCLGVAPVLVGAALIALPQILGNAASPFFWLVAASGAGILGIAAVRIRKLFFEPDASWKDLRKGLAPLLLLAAVAPAAGLLALAKSLHALSILHVSGTSDAALHLTMWDSLARDGALLAMGLLLGVAGALVWFVLANRAATLEEVEVAELLGEAAPRRRVQGAAEVIHLGKRRKS